MEIKSKLLCILCVGMCSAASGASVSWIDGTTSPSAWTISLPNPGTTNAFSFSGPTDVYANNCQGMASLGGTPTITVNPSTEVVELWFQGPAPTQCILIYQPVSGLKGDFGPLAPGNWVFKCTQPSIAFNLSFIVSGSMQTYHVDKDAPGPVHDGDSWDRAFTNIQNALAVATSGSSILVAEGVYKPDQGDSVTVGDRSASFTLKNGVALIGGYAGVGYSNPDTRDINTYPTVLNGDLNGDDLWGMLNRSDNSYQVVRAVGTTLSSTELNGFTITGGQADGPDPSNAGAGVYIEHGNPTLIDCTIYENVSGFGGGMACRNASPTLWNCLLTGNSSLINGGGLYCYQSSVTLTNCLMTGNFAYEADSTGGSAIYSLGSNLTLLDCTIADNSAPNGMAITSFLWAFPAGQQLSVRNSILYNGGDEILTNHADTVTISYSDVQGGWVGLGSNNINANPIFMAPGLWSIEGQWGNGDYRLSDGSPCIDTGSNALRPWDTFDLDGDLNTTEKLPIDLDGDMRVRNLIVDRGAYEQTGSGGPVIPEPNWMEMSTFNITTDVSNPPPAWPVTVTGEVTLTITMNFIGILQPSITPASLAGGTWTAWFDPDPGTIGPGSVTVLIRIRGEGVDETQLSPGLDQKIAELKILATPMP